LLTLRLCSATTISGIQLPPTPRRMVRQPPPKPAIILTVGGAHAGVAGAPDERTCSLRWLVEGPPHLSLCLPGASFFAHFASGSPLASLVGQDGWGFVLREGALCFSGC